MAFRCRLRTRCLDDKKVMQMSQVLFCTSVPSFPRRGGRDLQVNVAKPPHSGADGVVDQFDNRSLKTTPSAPIRNGTNFLLAQPPLLGKEGTAALEKHARRSEAKPR